MKNELFVAYDRFITDSELFIHLDPGHGGIVDGKYTTAPSKMWEHKDYIFYEGVFNREIVLNISGLLIEKNISHAFTTDTNFDVSLQTRISRAKSLKRLYPEKKHLFLSCHANADKSGKAKGIELYTMIGDTGSDLVATEIFNSLKGMGWRMRSDKTDGDPDKESKFYVLKHGELAEIDSVLVEYGFFTNKEEAIELMKSSVQGKLAKFTVEGVFKAYK